MENLSTLGTLRRDLKIYPQLLVNVQVPDKNKIMENEEIIRISKQVEEELGRKGRLLLRPSGTESLIRVMVEAETDEICKKYVDLVVEKIKGIV